MTRGQGGWGREVSPVGHAEPPLRIGVRTPRKPAPPQLVELECLMDPWSPARRAVAPPALFITGFRPEGRTRRRQCRAIEHSMSPPQKRSSMSENVPARVLIQVVPVGSDREIR